MAHDTSSERPVRCRLISPLLAFVMVLAWSAGCGGGESGVTETPEPGAARGAALVVSGSGKVAVTTQRYDNGRTGLNPYETALTLSAVTSSGGSFARRAAAPLDGAVYAQPLLVPGLTLRGAVHDVVFVATEHDSVYALDATSLTVLWQASLLSTSYGADPVTTTVSSTDVRCSDISPEYGITGTPVIDLASGTLYVVSNTKEGRRASIVYRLHALDMTTGAPKVPSVVIQATVSGSGAGSRRGSIVFNPTRHLQRPGLLLANGAVTIAFSGHCDVDPYHGWVMSYDAATLTQNAVWTTAPNGTEGGIWMSGAGITADDAGNAYLSIGNGTYDGATAFGNSVVRLDLTQLGTNPVKDWFTPANQATLASQDLDLGSGGVLLATDRNALVVGGKEGTLYVMSAGHLGGYAASNQNLQTLANAAGSGLYATPAYWDGAVFFQGKGQSLQAYAFDATGLLYRTWQSGPSSGFPGASPVVSADGTSNAIVWTVQTDGYGSRAAAILRAFDATTGGALYSSSDVTTDAAGPAVKFVVPLVANGSVYVGANKVVTRYGL